MDSDDEEFNEAEENPLEDEEILENEEPGNNSLINIHPTAYYLPRMYSSNDKTIIDHHIYR